MHFAKDEPLYENGLTIHPLAHPEWDLVIDSYCLRIYYCYRKEDTSKKLLAYFERELIAPVR